MRRLRFTAFAASAMLASTLAAGAQDIKIGLSGPFTGGSSSMGLSMRDGVRLGVAEINAAGGIDGRKFVLVERDDEARNELGVQIALEMVKEGVVAQLGYINTAVALASQRFFQDAKIPVITTVATGTAITTQFKAPDYDANYIFRVSAPDSLQAQLITDEAVDKRGFRKLAILADNTNYGQLGRADLEAALKAKGITPVAVEKFFLKEADMTAHLLKAKDAGAEAILTFGIGPELAQIANGMSALGWKVPLIGSWTLSADSFIQNAGPNSEGARMAQTFIQEGNTAKRQALIEAYWKAHKTDHMDSPAAVAQGYDAVLLLAAAIKQAGSTDGDKIRKALENLHEKVEGIVQLYDKPFTATDHEAVTPNILVVGEVKGGRIVYAYDADRAAASTLPSKTKP